MVGKSDMFSTEAVNARCFTNLHIMNTFINHFNVNVTIQYITIITGKPLIKFPRQQLLFVTLCKVWNRN